MLPGVKITSIAAADSSPRRTESESGSPQPMFLISRKVSIPKSFRVDTIASATSLSECGYCSFVFFQVLQTPFTLGIIATSHLQLFGKNLTSTVDKTVVHL